MTPPLFTSFPPIKHISQGQADAADQDQHGAQVNPPRDSRASPLQLLRLHRVTAAPWCYARVPSDLCSSGSGLGKLAVAPNWAFCRSEGKLWTGNDLMVVAPVGSGFDDLDGREQPLKLSNPVLANLLAHDLKLPRMPAPNQLKSMSCKVFPCGVNSGARESH